MDSKKKPDTRTGIQRIADERKRQVKKEGFDANHDDLHYDDELAWAAACYAAPEPVLILRQTNGKSLFYFEDAWPVYWDADWDKRPPPGCDIADRIRALEKSGALCAAEIDRLVRKQAGGGA